MQNTNEPLWSEQTRHTHPALQLAPGVFMLGFLVLGAIFALTSQNTREFPTDKDVVTGEWALAYEKNFNQGLPWRDTGIQGWGSLEYFAFGNGRPGVLIGDDGWLFTTEEFKGYTDEKLETERKLKTLVQVKKQLNAAGAELVVALLPSKARVYQERLGRHTLPSHTRNRLQDFRNSLLEAGVIAPDLLTPLLKNKGQQEVFLRTDTHWTPHGAQVVAESLKNTIEGLQLDLPSTPFETHPGKPVLHQGDLLKYVPLGPWQDRGPAADWVSTPTTEGASSDSSGLLGDPEDASASLLGDPEGIPVVLVGTSYSFMPKFHFEGALKQALQVDVLNMALEGKGPMLPMQEYLQSSAFKDTPPRVVVWEIPERFLPMPDPK